MTSGIGGHWWAGVWRVVVLGKRGSLETVGGLYLGNSGQALGELSGESMGTECEKRGVGRLT